MKKQRFIVPDPSRSPSEYLISALVVELRGGHEHVQMWSRGGLAGEFVLSEGDTALLAAIHGLAWDETL